MKLFNGLLGAAAFLFMLGVVAFVVGYGLTLGAGAVG